MTQNKQRITKLTKRERAAHTATGSAWGPGIIPRDETLAVLAAYGIAGDGAEGIIADTVDPLGRYRMEENFRQSRLSRKELIEQAEATADVARELYDRILNMDPHIRAWCVGDAYRAWNDIAFPESGEQYLIRLRALMNAAAAKARSLPSKVPSRTSHRDRLLAETVASVESHAAGVPPPKAREVAGALLACWDVESPQDAPKARKAINRAK